ETGVDLRYTSFQGNDDEALALVVSANLHRRHLTASQRAMVASKLTTMKHGGDRKTPDQAAKLPTHKAAAALGVSERSITDASAARKYGTPELAEAVESGVMPVSVAADLTHAPKEEQREAVENAKRACDAKGRPSAAAKKKLKAASTMAKAASGRKGK